MLALSGSIGKKAMMEWAGVRASVYDYKMAERPLKLSRSFETQSSLEQTSWRFEAMRSRTSSMDPGRDHFRARKKHFRDIKGARKEQLRLRRPSVTQTSTITRKFCSSR